MSGSFQEDTAMKALSIYPTYAQAIMCGIKTVECRTWWTKHRGDLLICSTAKKVKDTIPGHALCVVRLKEIVSFQKKHLTAACMEEMPTEFCYAWILDDVRIIRPIPLKGKQGLWTYDGEIEYLPMPTTDAEDDKMYHEIWEPLIV